MYRALVVALLIVASSASAASAQGINLRWGKCVADGGVRNFAFACNTNTGVVTLVTSFVLAAPLSQATGARATIDVVAADVVLPAWWNFRDCRSGSEFMDLDAIAPLSCVSPWPTCPTPGGVNSATPGVPSANAERIVFTRAAACTPHPTLAAGIEYVGPPLSINFNRTVGSPSCNGCAIGVCIVLNQMEVLSTSGTLTLTQPAIPPDSHVATWQGVGFTPGGACAAATPTKRTLWGAVKALYR